MRSAKRGLAPVDAARGTLIAYATAPGDVADDGDGDNGLYTASLLDALKVPGLTAEEVFKRVRASVDEQTNGQQGVFFTNRQLHLQRARDDQHC